MSLKDFDIESLLGDGAYSTVYKVKRKEDGKIYGLKKVKISGLSEKERLNALNEVRILASVKHPNVIAYKEAFLDEDSSCLCLILEYCDDGDLFQKITNLSKRKKFMKEDQIWRLFISVVRGLKELHDLNIMHRDLKSANVFLCKNGITKLGDMNVSKTLDNLGLNYT